MEPLKVGLIGTGRMGQGHMRVIAGSGDLELAGVCDINREAAEKAGAEFGCPAFGESGEMLAKVRPDIVVIVTGNTTHAPLTIQAAGAGAKAILCEKPMATSLADAKAMAEACARAGTLLAINHQRRVGPDLGEIRRLIDSGAIGDLRELRGFCAGDMLSDGTHLIDSMQWLSGDRSPAWVIGQIALDPPDNPGAPPEVRQRFGHVVETGATGVILLDSGVRVEVATGRLQTGRVYQEYEIVGSKGRIWRLGDPGRLPTNIVIADGQPGDCAVEFDPSIGGIVMRDLSAGEKSIWRRIPSKPETGSGLVSAYRKLAESVRSGTPHPMDCRSALPAFGILLAIYESARLNRRLAPPFDIDGFPLETMLKEKGLSLP